MEYVIGDISGWFIILLVGSIVGGVIGLFYKRSSNKKIALKKKEFDKKSQMEESQYMTVRSEKENTTVSSPLTEPRRR